MKISKVLCLISIISCGAKYLKCLQRLYFDMDNRFMLLNFQIKNFIRMKIFHTFALRPRNFDIYTIFRIFLSVFLIDKTFFDVFFNLKLALFWHLSSRIFNCNFSLTFQGKFHQYVICWKHWLTPELKNNLFEYLKRRT